MMRWRRWAFGFGVVVLLALAALRCVGQPDPSDPTVVLASNAGAESDAERLAGADESPQVRAPRDPALPIVRCIDARTERPLDGVRIEARLQPSGGTATRVDTVSDAEGEIGLNATGRWTLSASRFGYFDRVATFDLAAGVTLFALEPSARLEIRLRTPAGTPVPGVELALVPPLADGRGWTEPWSKQFDALLRSRAQRLEVLAQLGKVPAGTFEADDGWTGEAIADFATDANCRRVTDAEGRASWDRMPDTPGYRWGVRSTHMVQVLPPHERQRFRSRPDGTVDFDTEAPRALSGVIDLTPGRTTSIDATALVNGSVAGIVDFGAPVRDAHVRIVDTSEPEPMGGIGLLDRSVAADQFLPPGGDFVFEAVVPGHKLVRAFGWTESGGVRFAAVEFELSQGEAKDLGVLGPCRGSTLTLDPRLLDEQGRALAVDEVFEEGVATLQVQLFAYPRSRVATDRRIEHFELPIGAPLKLEGVADGTVNFQLRPGAHWRRRADRAVSFNLPDHPSLELAGDARLEIPIVVEEVVLRAWRVRFPRGATPEYVVVHALHGATCKDRGGNVMPDALLRGGGEAVERQYLARGRHSLLVHTQALPHPDAFADPDAPVDPGTPSSFYAMRGITVERGMTEELVIELEPGTDLEGELVGPDGTPRPNAFVGFRVGAWMQDCCHAEPYQARSDDAGRFHVRGLPPNQPFLASDGSRGTTGAAGETVRVIVRSLY